METLKTAFLSLMVVIFIVINIRELLSSYKTYKRGKKLGELHREFHRKYSREELFTFEPERPNWFWKGYSKTNP